MLSKKDCVSVGCIALIPCLTIKVVVIVTKKVDTSMSNNREMSCYASNRPAMMGENRYLALPAKDTNPEALENSSLDNRSVIVAL